MEGCILATEISWESDSCHLLWYGPTFLNAEFQYEHKHLKVTYDDPDGDISEQIHFAKWDFFAFLI